MPSPYKPKNQYRESDRPHCLIAASAGKITINTNAPPTRKSCIARNLSTTLIPIAFPAYYSLGSQSNRKIESTTPSNSIQPNGIKPREMHGGI